MDQYAVHTAGQLPTLLKAFRRQAGLTQEQLALRLGITQQSLSDLERNAPKVSAERLLQLLGNLGVEMVLQRRDVETAPVRSTTTGAAW